MEIDEDKVLEHLLSCDTCMGVIVDLSVSTTACAESCETLRDLLSERIPAALPDSSESVRDYAAGHRYSA